MQLSNGWLDVARKVLSPNCDERPQPLEISLLVIHSISLPPGDLESTRDIDAFFQNRLNQTLDPFYTQLKGVQVSAHFLIDRRGEITQFVACDHRAWHAGVSQFDNRPACNDFSLGIELQGDEITPYTDSQYEALILLTKALQGAYPSITSDRIVGHEHIAPDRKTDPGSAFDWRRFRQGIMREATQSV